MLSENSIVEHTLKVIQKAEEKVDSEIERLDNLSSDDLAQIRARRIKELKERSTKLQEWKALGHGSYHEVIGLECRLSFMCDDAGG